jgi:hypothetical protein
MNTAAGGRVAEQRHGRVTPAMAAVIRGDGPKPTGLRLLAPPRRPPGRRCFANRIVRLLSDDGSSTGARVSSMNSRSARPRWARIRSTAGLRWKHARPAQLPSVARSSCSRRRAASTSASRAVRSASAASVAASAACVRASMAFSAAMSSGGAAVSHGPPKHGGDSGLRRLREPGGSRRRHHPGAVIPPRSAAAAARPAPHRAPIETFE